MVLVLPAPERKPSFSEVLGSGLGQGLGQGFASGVERQMDFNQKLALQKAKETTEKQDIFRMGLETIGAMRQILDKGNVGRFSSIAGLFGGETARDRSELEQLGKSLIPLVAAGVPVRNQKEFEEYKKVITDPSSPIASMEGALDGLERLFSSKAESEERGSSKKSSKQKPKFDASNPQHRAKRDQLLKKFNGDREKVAEVLMREFSE